MPKYRNEVSEDTNAEPEPQPDMESEDLGDTIDVDLDDIDQPYATVAEGTYDITLFDAALKKSKEKGNPMLETHYTVQHPETGETVFIRDYPLLNRQDGKFRLKQLLIAAGLDLHAWTVAELVTAHPVVPAELTVETSEEYGEQNRLRRLLVYVPKVQH